MSRWTDKLTDKAKQIEQMDSEAFQLTDEDIEVLMPKVLEFYNQGREDADVFHVNSVIKGKQGCIFLVKTPNKDAKRIGGKSDYGDPRWTLLGTLFKYYGKDAFFGAWLTGDQWKQITAEFGNSYERLFFVYGNLLFQYHKIGDEENGKKVILNLDEFLERHEIENIDQIDKKELAYYYKTNAWKVIL